MADDNAREMEIKVSRTFETIVIHDVLKALHIGYAQIPSNDILQAMLLKLDYDIAHTATNEDEVRFLQTLRSVCITARAFNESVESMLRAGHEAMKAVKEQIEAAAQGLPDPAVLDAMSHLFDWVERSGDEPN